MDASAVAIPSREKRKVLHTKHKLSDNSDCMLLYPSTTPLLSTPLHPTKNKTKKDIHINIKTKISPKKERKKI